MLLTIPWFLAIYYGRVNLNNGVPNYCHKPKLSPPGYASPTGTGVKVGRQIAANSKVMVATAVLYLIAQIPAQWGPTSVKPEKGVDPAQALFDAKADYINGYCMFGVAWCIVFFFGYLYLQVLPQGEEEEKLMEAKLSQYRIDAIKRGEITLRGVMHSVIGATQQGQLLDISDKDRAQMKRVLKPFFTYYDSDRSETLSRTEFSKIMHDLHEYLPDKLENDLFNTADIDRSGAIDFNEFVGLMVKYTAEELGAKARHSQVERLNEIETAGSEEAEEDEEEESEEEDVPDDLAHLTPEEQQAAIKSRAFWTMGMGTILVLVFSDPAVTVLDEIGHRTGIPSFYVSFVLAPLASNASELVAAMKYGMKKTMKDMTLSLSTLLGAACMNNTFCLGIFYALVWKQRLVWNFSAEVASIILVELLVGWYALNPVQTLMNAYMVLLCFPGSLVFVWLMNNMFSLP